MRQFKIRASAAGTLMANAKGSDKMGETAKTYVKTWYLEQLYNRRKEFTSKQTTRGNLSEQEGIDLVANELGYFVLDKNTAFFEDDYFTGTPDVITSDTVIDIKSSWDCFTFPLVAAKENKV